jgi:hypothetical protein
METYISSQRQEVPTVEKIGSSVSHIPARMATITPRSAIMPTRRSIPVERLIS